MRSLEIKKQSRLLILLFIYLFVCSLIFLSLSVPPADFPICVMMFVVAVVGLVIAWRESRVWLLIWIGALAASIMFGALELLSGRIIAHQRSIHHTSKAASRSLSMFRFIGPTTTMQQVFAAVGQEDRDLGSGICILEYGLADGSHIWIGTADLKHIMYVRHGTNSLDSGELLYPKK
jgi:hypothetical protein